MNLLIDTHALLWWWSDNPSLSEPARNVLRRGNRVYVSAVVAWELAIKVNSGKLHAGVLLSDFSRYLSEEGFRRLAISTDHAIRAGLLPRHLADPFDRMLAAQAQALNLPIISADSVFEQYGVKRIW